MELLHLTDGQFLHYVPNKHLKILVSIELQKIPSSKSRICPDCFHICSCKEVYKRHIEI